ncbi:MAG: TIM barrel protein [Acidobacteria bacterium]|nr:TIM barrel protein [Acidobacteriota bacterium]
MAGIWPIAAGLAAPAAAAGQRKPNSRVSGVQIGLNVPYNFGNNFMSAGEVLERCLHLGVSAVELRSQPVELFLGIPSSLIKAASASGRNASPEQIAEQRRAAAQLRTARLALPMSRVREFRRMYEQAGVAIEIVKFDGIYARTDDEIDYGFVLAKTLGARALSCEIDVAQADRLGQFAEKHELMVGYHGHAETGPAQWAEAFGSSKYNGANLDLGHYVAGGHTPPVLDFLAEHHARITHVHVKDRKKDNGVNVPFGEGDTPIVAALQLIRDRKWRHIQATIEFEYPVAPGFRMLEMAKCVEYCRKALAL